MATPPFEPANAAPASAAATTLDSSPTSATLELFRAAIGPVNTDYYVRIFSQFDAKDRTSPVWNWAAGLLTLNWMALRQLWVAALAYLAAMLAASLSVLGIARLAFGLSLEAQLAWLGALLALSIALPGLFGNAWFYSACRKRMEKALAANATLADACAMLRRQASTRQHAIGLGIGNLLLAAGVAAFVGSLYGFGSGDTAPTPTAATPIQKITSEPQARAAAPLAQASSVPEIPASSVASAATPATQASTPLGPEPVTSAPPTTPASAQGPEALAPRASEPGHRTAYPAVVVPQPPTSEDLAQTLPLIANGQPKPTAPAAGKEKGKTAKKPAEKKTAPGKPAVAAPDAHILINVGLFANENNARNAATKLGDAGIPVMVQALDTAKGKRTRVRAGPFASLAEAERAAGKIQFLGLEAAIVRK